MPSKPPSTRSPLLPAIMSLALLACASLPVPRAGSSADTGELASLLAGHFSSAAQAANDPAFFPIELHVVRIWPHRSDDPWLYVEQAEARSPEKPYRQRVYRLEATGDVFISHVYEFKSAPLDHAGAFRAAAPLQALSPADLEQKRGCEVTLRRSADGRYLGATGAHTCQSNLRGAAFATSEVTLSATGLESWDRGFDQAGQQVWGSTRGPYQFLRDGARAQRESPASHQP